VDPTPSQPGVTVVYRPVVPIRLIGLIADAVFYGLLDTGADETLIPKEVADLIGVKMAPDPAGAIVSASGEISVSYGALAIEFGQGKEGYRWRTMVGVVEQPWKEALLGCIPASAPHGVCHCCSRHAT
jgi:hypothetical protein